MQQKPPNRSAVVARPRSSRACPSTPSARQAHRIVTVAAGAFHTLAVTDEGVLLACGRNTHGQLGLGSRADAPRLTRVDLNQFATGAACGAHHSLVATRRGLVLSCGLGSLGRLGLGHARARDGEPSGGAGAPHQSHPPLRHERSSPAIVVGAPSVGGDVGDGGSAGGRPWDEAAFADALRPELIRALVGVRVAQVAAGFAHSLARTRAGGVIAWGSNEVGQCGLGDEGGGRLAALVVATPTALRGLPGAAAQVACGDYHCVTLVRDGGVAAVFSWGEGRFGRLGHGGTTSERAPRLVEVLASASQPLRSVAAGGASSAAIDGAGVLWTWGSAAFDACGHGDGAAGDGVGDALAPRPVRALAPAAAAAFAARRPYRPPPPVCALTLEPPADPATTDCGHTFSRAALEKLRTSAATASALCPVCRAALGAASEPFFGLAVDPRFEPAAEPAAEPATGRCGGARAAAAGATAGPTAAAAAASCEADLVIRSVDCGEDHMAAVDAAGALYAWGRESHGRLGRKPRARATAHSNKNDDDDGAPTATAHSNNNDDDDGAPTATAHSNNNDDDDGAPTAAAAGSSSSRVGKVNGCAWTRAHARARPSVVVCGGSHTLALAPAPAAVAPAADDGVTAGVTGVTLDGAVHAPSCALVGVVGGVGVASSSAPSSTAPPALQLAAGELTLLLAAGAAARLALHARDALGNELARGGARFVATLVPAARLDPAALRAVGPPPAGGVRLAVVDEGGGAYAIEIETAPGLWDRAAREAPGLLQRAHACWLDVRLLRPARARTGGEARAAADGEGAAEFAGAEPVGSSPLKVFIRAAEPCAARCALAPAPPSAAVGLARAGRRECARMTLHDRWGNRVAQGGYAVRARLDHLSDRGASVTAAVIDHGDGSYALSYVTHAAGTGCLRCQVLLPPATPVLEPAATAPDAAGAPAPADAAPAADAPAADDARASSGAPPRARATAAAAMEWTTICDGLVLVEIEPATPSAARSTARLLPPWRGGGGARAAPGGAGAAERDGDVDCAWSGSALEESAGALRCAAGTPLRWVVSARDDFGNPVPAELAAIAIACGGAAGARACVRARGGGSLDALAELVVSTAGSYFVTLTLGPRRERIGPPRRLVVVAAEPPPAARPVPPSDGASPAALSAGVDECNGLVPGGGFGSASTVFVTSNVGVLTYDVAVATSLTQP
jgi:alpha-tubulin suppressor-like RCC1 family protein